MVFFDIRCYRRFLIGLFFTLLSLVTSMGSMATPTYQQLAMNTDQVESFCTDKPLWAAFDVSVAQCTVAVKDCLTEERFVNLDPTVVSEEFYQCVFEMLSISVDT